jgi:hypothetical protein
MKNRETRLSCLCPSAPCERGATLLGVVQPSGRVAFLPPGLGVDDEFARLSQGKGNPSAVRFRFSSRCAETACAHWREHRCGALDEVRAHLAPYGDPENLPQCAIRSQCRWHRQDGNSACSVCPLVITDLMAVGVETAMASV